MSIYDEIFKSIGLNSDTSAFNDLMSYLNDLIHEKPEYEIEFPSVYDWITRYADSKGYNTSHYGNSLKKDKIMNINPSTKKDDIKHKPPINNTIPKVPVDNTLIPTPMPTSTSIPTPTAPRNKFTESLKREYFDGIKINDVTVDSETNALKDSIKSYNDFSSSRISVSDSLDKEELSNKVNYILQYFFSQFADKLEDARKNGITKTITINLEVPIYRKNEGTSYKVVMNVEAHKKAVKMIHNFLTNKGYQKHNIVHTILTDPVITSVNNVAMSPKVTEKYTIEILL